MKKKNFLGIKLLNIPDAAGIVHRDRVKVYESPSPSFFIIEDCLSESSGECSVYINSGTARNGGLLNEDGSRWDLYEATKQCRDAIERLNSIKANRLDYEDIEHGILAPSVEKIEKARRYIVDNLTYTSYQINLFIANNGDILISHNLTDTRIT